MEPKLKKNNWKRLAFFAGGVAVLFYLAPFALQYAPENIQAGGSLLLMLLINQIFAAIVGWHSNYIPKYGVYIPAVVVVLYLLSELLYLNQITWSLEMNYLETVSYTHLDVYKRQAQRFGDFPPGGDFVVRIGILLQESLIPGLRQGVIFERESGRQSVLLQQPDLPRDSVEICLQEFAGFLMGHADEVVDVDDGRLLFGHGKSPVLLDLCGPACRSGKKPQYVKSA